MFAFILTLSIVAVLATVFTSVLKNIQRDATKSAEKFFPIESSVYWSRVRREATEAAEREAEREAEQFLERSVRNVITPFTIETPNVFTR